MIMILSMAAAAFSAEINPAAAAAADTSSAETQLIDDGALVRAPVKVFGKTLYFMIDTGCTRSALDRRYEDELGNALGTSNAGSPLGAVNGLPVFSAPKISVSDKTIALTEILCTDLNMPRLVTGQPCDGILGMDALQHWVVTFDFDRKIFALSDSVPEDFRTNVVEVPLRPIEPSGAIASLHIGRSQSFDFMIDTGDSSSLSLNAETWDRICSTANTRQRSTTLGGLNNEVRQSKILVLKEADLENLTYTNLHATLIPNSADPCHLGLGFFRRHLVAFDFPHGRMYLKPGKRFSLPDSEDHSGLHLLRQNGVTFVYSVDDGSPAAAQGMKSHDIVTGINGQDSSTLTMKTIRRLLRSADGTPVDVRVKRGEQGLEFKFTLRSAT